MPPSRPRPGTTSPRVAVDGWELLASERRRGIGRFLEGLLPPLSDRIGLTVLHRADEHDLPPGPDLRAVTRRLPRSRVRAGEVEHLVRLPRDLSRVDHDVAWSPGTLPLMASRRPWVHTLHDLAPLVLDGYGWDRRRLRATAWRLRRADRVVTPSRFAADEALAVLGLDADRVEVVPHGVPSGCGPDGSVDATVAAARPAVVGVGHPDPRKGTGDLVALGTALRRTHPDARVHVVGDVALPPGAPVVALGRVPEVAPVLRAADVVVVTSRHEGFGFVALEAMVSGAAVVAYDAAATREVVGDGGILVRVGDLAGLTDAVAGLLADDVARAEVAARGRARAADFSWERAADAYAALLREVAGA